MSTDLDRLQGSWDMLSLTLEGKALPAEYVRGAQIIVRGSTFDTRAMGAVYSGEVVIDETTQPRRFDLAFTSGPEKGATSLGIYELEGDTWRICLGLTGRPRPTAFVTTPGSGHALEELRRHPA